MKSKSVFRVTSVVWAVTAALTVGLTIGAGAYFRSQNPIVPGMSVQDVFTRMGKPSVVIQAGETIKRFGNHDAATARSETLIYHVFPKSTRRIVIEIDNDRVVRAELQLN